MEVLNQITAPTLFITSNKMKKQLLRKLSNNKTLVPIKFMDLEEFLTNYFFKVKKEAYFYLKEREQKKISILEEEINCLPFLTRTAYQSEKLNHLREILTELERENLLETNPFFHSYLETVSIIVYGYDLDPFYKNLFDQLHAKILKPCFLEKRKPVVYKFYDIEEEIGFVGGEILKKLQTGVSIDQIKILSLPEEYRNPVRRIFSLLHLPVETEEESKIFETSLGQSTLKYLGEVKSLEELQKKIELEFQEEAGVSSIVNILNEYSWFSGSPFELKDFLENDFKKASLSREHLKNKIECVSKEEIDPNNYYFLLGFNKENIPKVYQDEDFLTDKEKMELGLFTSNQKNKQEKENWKELLLQVPQLVITYKEKSAFNSWNESLLIEEMALEVKEENSSYQNSNLYNQVLLARYLDKLNKYGIMEKDLEVLYHTYSSLPYMTYDNQFSGIHPDDLKSYLNHKLLLSYSSINNFYKCGFRYYLSNILKVDPFESTFFTDIGSIFHNVLDHSLEPDFDFPSFFEKEVEKYNFSVREMVLLDKLKEELLFDIEVLKRQKEHTFLQTEYHEEKFYLPISKKDNLETTFMGVTDKIMALEENLHTYLSIIDYKTGKLPDNLNNVIYGIGMQLPIYLYLVNRSNKFSSPKIVGIYLQRIINKEIRRQIKKDYKTEKENSLKLVGFSTDNEEWLERFDDTYQDSSVIKGLKKGKNGFYQYSKVLSEEKFKKLENIVHEKIIEADQKIRKADFQINPKKIGKELVGCEFCKYKDICFRKEEDIVFLKEHKNLDFLGGEEDV